jgi:CelD/BcsL family acetyltransferase involved in cellulose biosynthesis
MTIYNLDPLTDSRWPEFIARHPHASVFHTRAWLQSLDRTYGYEPVVFTTSKGPELVNGVLFCQVRSWLTGKRLVSIPFSDHCQPLANATELRTILESLHGDRRAERWKYIELRPLSDKGMEEIADHTPFADSETFSYQEIDLRPDLATIYRGFHDSCIRRKIKKAEREQLVYEAGRSEALLEKFRRLLLLTRRRHKLPPQPALWFRNLVESMGQELVIHMLSKDADPVASIVTLTHKNALVYKYGCSDARFHNLGGTPLLFWKAIQRGKETGVETFDLGRSAPDDPGLIAFKEHLGAVTSKLKYYRSPAQREKKTLFQPAVSWAREAFAYLPEPMLTGAGTLLYRHMG